MCSTAEPLINHPDLDVIQDLRDWYDTNHYARHLRDSGIPKLRTKAETNIQCDRGDLINHKCRDHGTQYTTPFTCKSRFHDKCQEQNLKTVMLQYNRKLAYLAEHHKGRAIEVKFWLPLPKDLTLDTAVELIPAYRENLDRVSRAIRHYSYNAKGQLPDFSSIHCLGVIGNRQLFSVFLYTKDSSKVDYLHTLLHKNGVPSGEETFDIGRPHMTHLLFERHLKVIEPDSDEHAAANEIVCHGTRSRRPRTTVTIPKDIDPDLVTEEESPQDVVTNLEVDAAAEPVKSGLKCRVCGRPCVATVEYRLHGRLRPGYLDRLAPSD